MTQWAESPRYSISFKFSVESVHFFTISTGTHPRIYKPRYPAVHAPAHVRIMNVVLVAQMTRESGLHTTEQGLAQPFGHSVIRITLGPFLSQFPLHIFSTVRASTE